MCLWVFSEILCLNAEGDQLTEEYLHNQDFKNCSCLHRGEMGIKLKVKWWPGPRAPVSVTYAALSCGGQWGSAFSRDLNEACRNGCAIKSRWFWRNPAFSRHQPVTWDLVSSNNMEDWVPHELVDKFTFQVNNEYKHFYILSFTCNSEANGGPILECDQLRIQMFRIESHP